MLVRFSKTGKNNKFIYMAANMCRKAVPKALYRRRLGRALAELEKREDKDYILRRVDYYNKLDGIAPLPDDAPPVSALKLRNGRSAYYFDTMEYLR